VSYRIDVVMGVAPKGFSAPPNLLPGETTAYILALDSSSYAFYKELT
jgi:hypothetical protein